MAHKAHDVNDRLQLHNASISAANAAFVSATKREDARAGVDASESASLVFAHNAPGLIDADMSGDAQSLAAALDFDSMNADIQQTLENGDYSFLGKRPNTSQPAGGFGSMLHVRAESNSGRRHSIQTLMPSSDSSSSLTGFGPMAGAVSGARSMSISVDAYGSMAYTDAANHGMDMAFNAEAHNTSGAGFLMSPPRLTVSMSNNADHASAAAAATFAPSRRYWAIVGNGPNQIAAREIRIKLSELCYKSIACDVTEDKKHIDLSSEPLILVCAAGLVGGVCERYAVRDAERTLLLGMLYEEAMDEFQVKDTYDMEMKLLPVTLANFSAKSGPNWLTDIATLGLTAGASAPEELVREVVNRIATIRPIREETVVTTEEKMVFKLPRQLVD